MDSSQHKPDLIEAQLIIDTAADKIEELIRNNAPDFVWLCMPTPLEEVARDIYRSEMAYRGELFVSIRVETPSIFEEPVRVVITIQKARSTDRISDEEYRLVHQELAPFKHFCSRRGTVLVSCEITYDEVIV